MLPIRRKFARTSMTTSMQLERCSFEDSTISRQVLEAYSRTSQIRKTTSNNFKAEKDRQQATQELVAVIWLSFRVIVAVQGQRLSEQSY